MNNNKQKNAHKNQQPRNPQQPKRDILPIPKPVRMEVHLPEIPSKDDFVTIPLDEYATLISIATNMDILVRWAKAHSQYDKVQFNELLLLLGADKEEDK